MTPMKRNASILAIIIASIAFGMILTADLGLTRKSNAQQITQQSTSAPLTSVTIPSFASLADRVMPAVVSITTTEVVKESAQRRRGGVDPFDFFFPDPRRRPDGADPEDDERKQVSGGSGFIISPDGYILTNNHVVEGATKVEVHYGPEGSATTTSAKVIGRDAATDIALIKIESKSALPTVTLGNSDNIRVGDWAIAIGNPLQFENSLTVGVISGRGRSLGINESTTSFENFIQTDAAINFGNSGGPLLNINGEVVGINTAMRAYAQNLGFATPINIAKTILPQLRDAGKVTRGYLGIRVANIDTVRREAFNLPSTNGVFVESVEEGKPADKAGIQHGDVITRIDEKPINNMRDLIDYVSSQPPGTAIKVSLVRNGERRTLNARTSERPGAEESDDEQLGSSESPARNKLGMSVQEITPAFRQSYGIDETVRGVIVTSVKQVSAAADAGLTEGDVITEVNGRRVTSVADLREVIDRAQSGQYVRMYVTRSGRGGRSQSFFAIAQIP